MNRFLITRLQLVLVASLHQFTAYHVRKPGGENTVEHHLLCHVKLKANFFVQLQLHNQEWVPSLALSQRGVESKNNERMCIVILGKQEEFLDRRVLNLVIVGFAT